MSAAPGIPGQQMSLFDEDVTGQKRLFNVQRPSKPKRKAKANAAIADPPMIPDLPKQVESLPGQKQLTMEDHFAQLKRENDGTLLLFRMGDFYEAFYEDARNISEVLGLTLTSRGGKRDGGEVAMAGFPHHALEAYLVKLIAAGHRVAICDRRDA